jgi:heat shock protein HtpX
MINQVKTIVLLGVLTTLLVAAAGALAPSALPLVVGVAVLANVGAYLFSDRLLLASHGARDLTPAEAPHAHAALEELCARAGLPRPRLVVIEDPVPNAFATGPSPGRGVVALTTGLLELLSPRELRGVIAHELAHIGNRDTLVATIAATLSAAVSGLAQVVALGSLFGGASDDEEQDHGGGGLLAALVAPVAASLVQLGVSRSREYLADATAAGWTGDPDGLALALERLEAFNLAALEAGAPEPRPATAALSIVNPLAALGSLLSTHPPIEDRVRRLRALAPRPRPAWSTS